MTVPNDGGSDAAKVVDAETGHAGAAGKVEQPAAANRTAAAEQNVDARCPMGLYVTFQMAEVTVSRQMFQENPDADRPAEGAATLPNEGLWGRKARNMMGEVR